MEARGGLSLLSPLGVNSKSVVTLIGSGGKTTIMLSLAAEAEAAGVKVIVTTTTKIWPVLGKPLIETEEAASLADRARHALIRSPLVVLGESITAEGKVRGLHPDLICRLARERIADFILVEGDGAAGRSLKAHRPGEPVVPACSSHVVIVAGIDAVGRIADDETVHRLEVFCRVSGARTGQVITPEQVTRSLLAARRYCPPGAAVAYLLNKADDAPALAAARAVADGLADLAPGARVVATCRGRLAPDAAAPRGSAVAG
jgi:probable selenium-dependent hydroxylase accessory protein YqeC